MDLRCALLVPLLCVAAPLVAAEPSLVPKTPSTAPDYFCTWNLQGFVSNYSDSNAQADAMTEADLFGKGPNQNWVEMYPEARGAICFWSSMTRGTYPLARGPATGAATRCAAAWNSTTSDSPPTRASPTHRPSRQLIPTPHGLASSA